MRIEQIAQHLRQFRSPPTSTQPTQLRRAAVAIILRDNVATQATDILFIRRAEKQNDPWSGHIAFPGGRVEANDDSLLTAAIRETREEIAIDLASAGQLLGQLDDVFTLGAQAKHQMCVTPFIFALFETPTIVPNVDEVQEALWLDIPTLTAPTLQSELTIEKDDRSYTLPAVRLLPDRVIWGLTHRMLFNLFDALNYRP